MMRLLRPALFALLLSGASTAFAQDGTIRPIAAHTLAGS